MFVGRAIVSRISGPAILASRQMLTRQRLYNTLQHTRCLCKEPWTPAKTSVGTSVRTYRIPRVVNSTGTAVHFTLPCLSYHDFDRAGNISPWKLCLLFECGGTEATKTEGFLNYVGDFPLLFVLVAEYDISRHLYRQSQEMKFEMPINVLVEFINTTRSTITLSSRLRDPTEHFRTLASQTITLAHINPVTRKSWPWPEWMREIGELHKQSDNKVQPYESMQPPSGNFVQTFRIMGSDLDERQHTGNSAYVRFCMDGANEASLQGQLRHFQGDISQYLCKTMRVLYSAESRHGDVLDVHLWEDDTSPYVIHHVICRHDKPIFQCTIQFYAPQF